MLRAVAFAGLLPLLLAGFPAAAGGSSLRIDLSAADPIGVEDLPGILEEEIEALRAVAGPGPQNLAQRLSRTGVPPVRLREWVPYLELLLEGPGRSIWSTRTSVERTAASDVQGRIDLRFAQAVTDGELTARVRGDRAREGSAESVLIDGRGAARVGSATLLWGGCLEGSSGGIDPWSDPLRAGRALSSPLPRAGIAARSTSRGLALERDGFFASGWRESDARSGGLVAWRGAARAFWLGRVEGRGGGGGAAVRIGTVAATSALHKTDGSPPTLRLGVSDPGQGTRLATAWPLRERADGRTVVVDGSIARAVRTCRLSLRGTLLGHARPDPPSGRGGLGVSWRRGRLSSVCEAAWSETQRKLRVVIEAEHQRDLHLRLEIRGRLAGPSHEGSIDLATSKSASRIRGTAGLTLRTGGAIPFASNAAAGGAARIALHARGSLPRGSARVDFALIAPLATSERLRLDHPVFKIVIEQTASRP